MKILSFNLKTQLIKYHLHLLIKEFKLYMDLQQNNSYHTIITQCKKETQIQGKTPQL